MLKIFKNRIFLIYALIIFASFSLLNYSTNKNFEKENLNNRIKIAKAYLAGLEKSLAKEKATPAFLQNLAKEYFSLFSVRMSFIDETGKVLADSEVAWENLNSLENHLSRPEVKEAFAKGFGFSVRRSETLGKDMFYYAEKTTIKNKIFVFRAAFPMKLIDGEIAVARKKNSLYFLIFSFISVFAAYIALEKAFHPLERIIYASKRYAAGDFSHRIVAKDKGEIKKLAQTLNYMAESIEKQIKELERKNRQLSAIFENMQEAVVLVNAENKVESYNKNFETLFLRGLKNPSLAEIFKNAQALETAEAAQKTLRKMEQEFFCSINLKHYKISAIPLSQGEAKPMLLIVVYDIDREKRLESLKREFIANLSHEIKTPITVIKTTIETILEDEEMKKEDLKNFLRSIEKNSNRISNIAGDIISLNYLESDTIKLKKEKINLFSHIQQIAETFGAAISAADLKFSNQVEKGLFLEADKDILERAFFNLFDNAVKFNVEKGFLTVKSLIEKKELFLIFENSGPQIPPESIERIFERFYTADKSRSRLKGGTGLGLSIVKHAVQLHGASVKAESFTNLNRFTLIFPL